MLPRLYPIVDAANHGDSRQLLEFARQIISGGATLLQYRNKKGNARGMLSDARNLKTMYGDKLRLIMNDRADLCLAAGFDGLHVGQDDLSTEAARFVVAKEKWIGVSTHNLLQAIEADAT